MNDDQKEEEAEYDFIQAQLSPNPKHKRHSSQPKDEAPTDSAQDMAYIDSEKFASQAR